MIDFKTHQYNYTSSSQDSYSLESIEELDKTTDFPTSFKLNFCIAKEITNKMKKQITE